MSSIRLLSARLYKRLSDISADIFLVHFVSTYLPGLPSVIYYVCYVDEASMSVTSEMSRATHVP